MNGLLLLQEVNAVGLDFPFLLFAMSNWYVPGTLFSLSAWKEGWGDVSCGIRVFTAQALVGLLSVTPACS